MGIISGSGSFRGRFGDHFRVGDPFGVGITSGAVQSSPLVKLEFGDAGFCGGSKNRKTQQASALGRGRTLSPLRHPCFPLLNVDISTIGLNAKR